MKGKAKNGKLVGKYPSPWEDNFDCNRMDLVSLEGAPSIISGSIYCYNNPVLDVQNINHHIKKIGGSFWSDSNLSGLISLLMIEHPPKWVASGTPISGVLNKALEKIHSGQDRMEAIMEAILNTPDEHVWQLGEIE